MTRTTAFIIFAISLLSVGSSQLVFKARMTALAHGLPQSKPYLALALRCLADPHVWAGGLLVMLGAGCWYLALTKLPLSLMLPVASVIAPCASIGAYFFFGESLTLPKICAIAVIMTGVAWLGWLNA